MCGCIIRLDPARLQGSIAAVLEAGCRLLFIAERRETLRLRGDARGCNGHRRRRMVRPQPTRVRCPSRLRGRQFATGFLRVQLEFWDAAGPRDRLNFKT